MCRKLIFLIFALGFCLTSSVQAATIIWVSDNKTPSAGVPADQAWVDLLVAQGYTVDLSFRNQEGRTLDAAKIAALNAADLIIVSRDISSGSYDDGDEPTQWNSVTTPLILQIAHIARSNRWVWVDTSGYNDSLPPAMEAVELGHPVFTGVTLAANNQVSVLTEASSFVNTTDAGNGTLIAKRADNDQVWIVEWQAGQEFYAGSGQTAASPRMHFASGTDSGVDGRYNLTAEGKKLFLNAVRYMLGEFVANPGQASNPKPDDEATDVPRDVVLSWTPGIYAPPINGHKVYLSENFSDVNDGIGGIAQDANTYTPDPRLDFGTTYYWRVDEVNGPPDYTVYEGDVWSFTTEPFAYPIENITATASSSAAAKGPENTINSSGLDESGLLHDNAGENNMWLSGITGPQPTWIEYEFDRVCKLHQMWVWNSNESLEPAIGLGFKDVSVEYSANGTEYTTLGTTHEFARAPGTPDYAHNTTIDFGGSAAKYVRLTANSNWGGVLNQYGLSEVRFFYIPVNATEPYPDSGATGVVSDVVLGWKAGREAVTHDVYLSTDEQAVIDRTAPVVTVAEPRYGPLSLDLGKTYYWRVDEVNEAETITTWPSALWSFTTSDHIVVDDFESYNDLDPEDPESKRIFNAWIDGYEVPTNGSLVGYENPPFCEQTIVHGGEQAMPYFFDNSGTANYSEATLTLSGQDWTIKGVKALSLWFRGNRPAFVEAPAGTYAINAGGPDIWGTADQFRYVWKQLSGDGEIVAQVLSVQQTDGFAKAGVMIRNTLDADSANAMAFVTDGGRVGWQYRVIAAGGDTVSTRTEEGAITAPHWVKLTRQGNTFTAKHSSNGVTWEDMFEPANPQELSFKNILMSPNLYIGLALTSHVAGVTCEAVFSDVQITGMVSGQFTPQAIGADMPANGSDPMYVALANSGGTPAVVYHDDPSAAQIDTWSEWRIDLQAFADQGVSLTNVNTIAIGFGDKSNPQPGGSGKMLFDDISLYPSR